jgi:hypothetical protein
MQEVLTDVPLYGKDFGGNDFREVISSRPLSRRDTPTAVDRKRLGELLGAGIDSENHWTLFYTNGIVDHTHSSSGAGKDCSVYFYE